MRIAIIGPGSMGCLFGGFISKAGYDVTFLDYKKERIIKLAKEGMTIEGIKGIHHMPIKITDSLSESPDILLISVKAYNTKDALEKFKNIITDKTIVMSLQNGLGVFNIIRQFVKEEQIILGVTSEGANTIEDGHIRYTGKGRTFLGRVDNRLSVCPAASSLRDKLTKELKDISEIFKKADFDVKLVENIESSIWSKLIINVGINAPAGIFNVPNNKLLTNDMLSLVWFVVKEASLIAKAKGIELAYPDAFEYVQTICSSTGENINSMLQDIRRNKQTEIDFINGVIVEEGKKLGISTPVNEAIVKLIKSFRN